MEKEVKIAQNITLFSITKTYGMYLKRFWRNKINLEKQLKKSLTVNEIAFYTGLPKEKVREYEKLLHLFSIDDVNYDINTEDFINLAELKCDVHKLLMESDLTELEMIVVKGRYGFNGKI